MAEVEALAKTVAEEVVLLVVVFLNFEEEEEEDFFRFFLDVLDLTRGTGLRATALLKLVRGEAT